MIVALAVAVVGSEQTRGKRKAEIRFIDFSMSLSQMTREHHSLHDSNKACSLCLWLSQPTKFTAQHQCIPYLLKKTLISVLKYQFITFSLAYLTTIYFSFFVVDFYGSKVIYSSVYSKKHFQYKALGLAGNNKSLV